MKCIEYIQAPKGTNPMGPFMQHHPEDSLYILAPKVVQL